MKERRISVLPERTERTSDSTRSAPGSSLRIASTAEVSSTKRAGLAIPPAVPAAIREEPPYRPRLPRAAERGDRIVGDGDDAHGAALDDPLERRAGTDPQLPPDRSRDRDLSPLGDSRTHVWRSIMPVLGRQAD